MCLFEIRLFTLSMLMGSIYFFFCHLLWRTSCQVQCSSPWMSYQDLFFWQKSHCNQNRSESLSISGACMGMNNTESHLAQFQHFFYHFSFMTFIFLRKLYACSFNAKNTKQHTVFLAVCSDMSEYTLRGTKYRSNTAVSPPYRMLPQAALLTRLTQAGKIH